MADKITEEIIKEEDAKAFADLDKAAGAKEAKKEQAKLSSAEVVEKHVKAIQARHPDLSPGVIESLKESKTGCEVKRKLRNHLRCQPS